MDTYYYNSPIGILKICANENAITHLDFGGNATENVQNQPKIINSCVQQLDEYFTGKRKVFDLKLQPEGTEFQMKVWKQLQTIPYGKTASYGEIAHKIGQPNAQRAVGGANNKNKISIVIPCHRVIGSTGKLVGYGGELWRKEWLLDFEKKH